MAEVLTYIRIDGGLCDVGGMVGDALYVGNDAVEIDEGEEQMADVVGVIALLDGVLDELVVDVIHDVIVLDGP